MTVNSPKELLESAYEDLGYAQGELYEGTEEPGNLSEKEWVEKGEWLALTKKVEAEKLFFVENNPVVVFAQSAVNKPEKLRQLFNTIWSMCRPRLLFLATPGQLAVYDLAKAPVRTKEEWARLEPLEVAKSANEVAKKLKAFRREQLETGRLFEEPGFGDLRNRADKALISNLKEVRRELIKEGLGGERIKFAHALIGRSIFIRYLEDREILIPEDFKEIAAKKKKWSDVLKNEVPRPRINLSEVDSRYARVLSDKDFTFALFEKLAEDFNGDMFPDIEQEKEIVTQVHLNLMQDLLFGDVGKEKRLFFYAYQFKIVPIELISSIYEEFYDPHIDEEKKDADGEKNKGPTKKSSEGAYYTPLALVEFLVNQVLTPERLKARPKPRVVDPACGSGIFLVEAFRRIVRNRRLELGRKPTFQNLQVILREQIAGIEINPEAIRIAAFSLYLAMLHYLDPPSIREQIYERGNHLPNLVFDEKKQKQKSYNILLAKNAFDSEYIDSNPILAKSFSSSCADIVIGNPPWGSAKKEGEEARRANNVAVDWCKKNKLAVGRGERSQLFIWKALDLLRSDGISGLLVHTNTFLMHHDNSEAFRKDWGSKADLRLVYNFSHVRKVFFKAAIAPFAAIIFNKGKRGKMRSIEYWSAKYSRIINQLQSVVLSKNDLRYIHKDQELWQHYLWKTFWWGNHRDKDLIDFLQKHRCLKYYSDIDLYARGLERGSQYPSEWLKNYKYIETEEISRYGLLDLDKLKTVPKRVNRRGKEKTYIRTRILVKRGISQRDFPKGLIVAHLASDDFAFLNSVYGIKLKAETLWKYKCLLGILWSSLARYYLLLTTYDFGVWHDEIRLKDELMRLPVCFPTALSLRNRIVNIVDKLRSSVPEETEDLFQIKRMQNTLTRQEISKLEKELDEAIFELYELSDAEIDLVRDMCEITLPYYYSPEKSSAGRPILKKQLRRRYGTCRVLPENTDIADYIKIFAQSWEAYLDKGTEFHWQIYQPEETDSMIAIEFSIQQKGATVRKEKEVKSWSDVLQELEENLTEPFHSSRIYIEGMVRAVMKDYILVIKRNEKRLWTRSMAREDAEAALVKAMNRNLRDSKPK